MPRRTRIFTAGYPMHMILRRIDSSAVFFGDDYYHFFFGGLRAASNGGFVLGGIKFEKRLTAMLGRTTWKGVPGRPSKSEVEEQQGELPMSKTWSVRICSVT